MDNIEFGANTSGVENASLELLALEIPGHTGPLLTGEWGINIAAAMESFPRHGLQLFIDPWAPMGAGDSVEVFLGGLRVVSDIIDADKADKRLTMFIPYERLTNGFTTISYRVTRIGAIPEPSDDIKLYVKLDRPGGNDPNDDPGHSNMTMTIPVEIVQDGVDKDTANQGVPVTINPYLNMAEGDTIRLNWGGQFLIHTVAKNQIEDPAANPIVILVDEISILAAGDSDYLPVAFEVYDVVNNRSEDWGSEVRIDVYTNESLLAAPIIKEAINDVLNLDDLGDEPVTVQILATGKNYVVGDEIIVNLKGTATNGTPVSISLEPAPITSVPSIVEITMPSADIDPLKQSQAVFSCWLVKADGSPELTSKGQFVQLTAQVKRLAAPIAMDASEDALDPDLPRTVIEIPWDKNMVEGQLVELKWLGTRPDLSIYLPELDPHPITHGEALQGSPIHMTVPGRHLAAINGGTLELYYQLMGEMRTVITHDSLYAAVLHIGEPQAELSIPTVVEEVDGVLNPDDVPFGTRLIVPRYNGSSIGDEVHYEWLGSVTGLKVDSINITSVTVNKPMPFDIDFTLIEGNQGGTVDASYYVVRANGAGTSTSNTLALKIGAELTLPPATVGDAPNAVLDPMLALMGATVTVAFNNMLTSDLIGLSWNGRDDLAAAQNGDASCKVDFAIPVSAVAAAVGKTVPILYAVVRNSNVALSEGLSLTVSAIPESELLKSKPVVPEADPNTDELDLSTLSEDATVRVPKWPLISTGQRVWLTLSGTTQADETMENAILTAYPITTEEAQNGVAREVSRAILESLKDGSTLTVVCKIGFDGVSDDAQALTFPELALHVKEDELTLPAPIVTEASAEGTLDPVTLADNAHVSVSYTRINAGDRVKVDWDGSARDHTTSEQTAVANTPLNFVIPRDYIHANTEGTVNVTYTVTRSSVLHTSDPLNLIVKPIPPLNDHTDFANESWNDWEPGSGAAPEDWALVTVNSHGICACNATRSDNSQGPVLYKKYNNLKINQKYEFSLEATSINNNPNLPILSLSTEQGSLTEPVTILYGPWAVLKGTFTSESSTRTFTINSHEASGIGNDYYIDYISVNLLAPE